MTIYEEGKLYYRECSNRRFLGNIMGGSNDRRVENPFEKDDPIYAEFQRGIDDAKAEYEREIASYRERKGKEDDHQPRANHYITA